MWFDPNISFKAQSCSDLLEHILKSYRILTHRGAESIIFSKWLDLSWSAVAIWMVNSYMHVGKEKGNRKIFVSALLQLIQLVVGTYRFSALHSRIHVWFSLQVSQDVKFSWSFFTAWLKCFNASFWLSSRVIQINTTHDTQCHPINVWYLVPNKGSWDNWSDCRALTGFFGALRVHRLWELSNHIILLT